MQLFSESSGGYLRVFKPGILLFVAVALVRLILQPIGVPIAIGGMVFSVTITMLLLIVGYGVFFGIFGGRVGDPVVSAVFWVVLYTVVGNLFMAGSYSLGVANYYTDAAHIGQNPNIPIHVWAHVRALPVAALIGSVLALISFGVAKLGSRLFGGPRSTAQSA